MSLTTLIAIIMGIALSALAAIGMSNYYYSAKTNTQTLAASGAMNTIAGGVEEVFGSGANGSGNYAGLNNASAIAAGVIPDTLMKTGDSQSIYAPWGRGAIMTLSGGTTFWQAAWTKVPGKACARFALSQSGNAVSVNGSSVQTQNNSDAAAQVATACQAASNDNSVTFSFGEAS